MGISDFIPYQHFFPIPVQLTFVRRVPKGGDGISFCLGATEEVLWNTGEVVSTPDIDLTIH